MDNGINESKFLEEIRNAKTVNKVNKCDDNILEVLRNLIYLEEDEDFKLFAIEEKKYLKLCKHCGKAFTAPNPKTEYDTFSCKNQENVYKSRARNK